ncbi:MAG: hypothetical protein GY943_34460, partial [Chloroflexi bacterium]|nr:hypothetical protein [Chloroflexota bacterium]
IKALERAAPSVFLANGGWFDFGWFVKNDENWRKCYEGNYDNGQQTNGRQPTANSSTHHALHGQEVKQVQGEF